MKRMDLALISLACHCIPRTGWWREGSTISPSEWWQLDEISYKSSGSWGHEYHDKYHTTTDRWSRSPCEDSTEQIWSASCVLIQRQIKRTQWSMKFAYTNLAVSAACMVLSMHVKDKIRCIQNRDCILAPNSDNFYQCLWFPNQEGVYLYFDSNKGCFARSGKVTCQFEASNKVIASSHFYDMYPLSTCVRVHNRGTNGTFESLQRVVAAGWSPTTDTAKLLDSSWKYGGFFQREIQ